MNVDTLHQIEQKILAAQDESERQKFEHQFHTRSLENLSFNQQHKLIQKAWHVEELKDIWRRTWGMEYPYYTNITGEVFKEGE